MTIMRGVIRAGATLLPLLHLLEIVFEIQEFSYVVDFISQNVSVY